MTVKIIAYFSTLLILARNLAKAEKLVIPKKIKEAKKTS